MSAIIQPDCSCYPNAPYPNQNIYNVIGCYKNRDQGVLDVPDVLLPSCPKKEGFNTGLSMANLIILLLIIGVIVWFLFYRKPGAVVVV